MKEYSEQTFMDKQAQFSSCGLFYEQIEEPIEEHVHNSFIEIVYVMNGKAIEHINKTAFKVSRGDLLFINYGSTHSFEPQGKFEYVNIGFAPEVLIKRINDENAFNFILLTSFNEVRQNDEKLFNFSGKDRVEIENLFEIMLIEAERRTEKSDFVIENCLNIILSLVIEKCKSSVDDKNTWGELTEYINKNLGEKITLDDLAKKCYYNPSYFSRTFKERFGVNVSQYIKQKRVELARKMLLDGDTIEYIVEKAGFSSKHMLYSAFEEIEGITISEFRENEKSK